MNDRIQFERDLAHYLEQQSTSRAPDGLLAASLLEIDSTKQRPVWRLLGRWVPGRRLPVGRTRLGLAVILLLALAIATVGYVGSSHRVPPPFGPARSGVIAVDLHQQIGILEPDGTGLRMLTSGQGHQLSPTFSPDGTRIAYLSEGAGFSDSLVVMDADGQFPMTLAEGLRGVTRDQDLIGSGIGLTWAPDSRHIAISAVMGDDREPRIYVVAVDRPGATELGGPDMHGVAPSWSPDGSWIAFKRIYPCCGGPPDSLWLMSDDGTDAHQLSARTGTREALIRLAWAPDGSRLAFLAPGDQRTNDIFVIGLDGTPERNVTNSPQDDLWPAWSPDGTRLAFVQRSLGTGTSSTAGAYVVGVDNAGTSDPVRIADASITVTAVAWSPDGTQILGFDDGLYSSRTDNIVILDPTGHAAPNVIPVTDIGSATWQRLAP